MYDDYVQNWSGCSIGCGTGGTTFRTRDCLMEPTDKYRIDKSHCEGGIDREDDSCTLGAACLEGMYTLHCLLVFQLLRIDTGKSTGLSNQD